MSEVTLVIAFTAGIAMVTDFLCTLNIWILRLIPFRPAIEEP